VTNVSSVDDLKQKIKQQIQSSTTCVKSIDCMDVILYHGDFRDYCILDTHVFDYILENKITHLKLLAKQIGH
jgi:hypothetical protein